MAALERFEEKNGVSHTSSLERAKILIEVNEFRAANTLLINLLNEREIIQLLTVCNAQLNEDEIFFEILKIIWNISIIWEFIGLFMHFTLQDQQFSRSLYGNIRGNLKV